LRNMLEQVEIACRRHEESEKFPGAYSKYP
jgi:hypothetical protein